MKTKIILVVVFALALSLALVVSVGATSLSLVSPDVDVAYNEYTSGYMGSLSPYMNFQYAWFDDSSNNFYCFIILDLESFKVATSGLSYEDFESLAYSWDIDYNVLSPIFSAFTYYNNDLGFNNTEEMWSYCQNYEHYGREQVQQAFQIGFDDGRVVGSEEGYQNGLTDGYQNGFDVGYEQGEAIGFGDGLTEGYNNGYNNGLVDGKNEGYNDGLEDSNAFKNGILAIFSAPVYILNNVLNFDVLGINLYSLITSILTIIIVAWVIKKLAN